MSGLTATWSADRLLTGKGGSTRDGGGMRGVVKILGIAILMVIGVFLIRRIIHVKV